MTAVDVIIPTYNRPASLAACLEALAAQDHRDIRLIVVDDHSREPAAEVVARVLEDRLAYRVIRTDANRGPAHARNIALAAAEAAYVCFIDDDVRPAPDLVAAHLDAIRAPGGPWATFGPLAAPADWKPTPWNLWEWKMLEREYERMQAGAYQPGWRQFFTGNAMVNRRLVLDAGGFDERFTRAEDIELGLRMAQAGCKFRFVPGAVGWHYSQRTLANWLAIPRAYARFDVAIDALHPGMGWLDLRDSERAHRPLRHRRLARPAPLRTAAVSLAVATARAAHAVRWTRLAVPALSAAYDLEYTDALRAARPRDHQPQASATITGGNPARWRPGP